MTNNGKGGKSLSNRLEVGKSLIGNDFIQEHFYNEVGFGCGALATICDNGQIVICDTPLYLFQEFYACFQFGALKFYDYTCKSDAHVLLIRGAVEAELYIDPEKFTDNGIEQMSGQYSSLLIFADAQIDIIAGLRYVEVPKEVKEFIKKEYYAAKERTREAFLSGYDEVMNSIYCDELEKKAKLIGIAKNIATTKSRC